MSTSYKLIFFLPPTFWLIFQQELFWPPVLGVKRVRAGWGIWWLDLQFAYIFNFLKFERMSSWLSWFGFLEGSVWLASIVNPWFLLAPHCLVLAIFEKVSTNPSRLKYDSNEWSRNCCRLCRGAENCLALSLRGFKYLFSHICIALSQFICALTRTPDYTNGQ